MGRTSLILAFDVGTTSTKSCLYDGDEDFRLLGSAMHSYSLSLGDRGEAEQNPMDWVQGLIETTRQIMIGIAPERLAGISFSSQMQGLVLADEKGNPLRSAMSYMDQRAVETKEGFARGIKVDGIPLNKLLPSIRITGIAPTSVKDPLWKYLWVRDHEPNVFARVRWWLDVKDFLILKLTGKAVCTRDSACAAGLFDNRPGRNRWSDSLCRAYGVNRDHLPPVIRSHDIAGGLSGEMAPLMGLREGTPVFGGGGDASAIGLGAGAVKDNQAHLYMGTSGWISAVTQKRILDIGRKIASITCAIPDRYHYFCEQETSGKCLEWVRDHLALDEIGIYLKKISVAEDSESAYRNLFEYLNQVIGSTPAGSNGVLFTPWLHGSRSPFEDPHARGMFFNLGLRTGKRDMIRAVVEGLAFNSRWMLESLEKKLPCQRPLRFVGGGALSPVTAQIMADVTGREIEVPPNPHNAGALGAALIAALGLGFISSYGEGADRISVEGSFHPDHRLKGLYDRQYKTFRELYRRNKKFYSRLNGGDE